MVIRPLQIVALAICAAIVVGVLSALIAIDGVRSWAISDRGRGA